MAHPYQHMYLLGANLEEADKELRKTYQFLLSLNSSIIQKLNKEDLNEEESGQLEDKLISSTIAITKIIEAKKTLYEHGEAFLDKLVRTEAEQKSSSAPKELKHNIQAKISYSASNEELFKDFLEWVALQKINQ